MQRDDVARAEYLGQVAALDVSRKIAVDEVGIAGDDAVEHVAADVRHPLADTAQPHDAERHVARAAQRSRREVVPLAGVDVAVVGDDVAHQREGERKRMRRDLADAVVRRIGDPDAVPRAGLGVDGIEAGADAADDARRSASAATTRSVIGAYCSRMPSQSRAASMTAVLGLCLRDHEVDAGGGEERALELDVRKIVVGEQDPGHGRVGDEPDAIGGRQLRSSSSDASGFAAPQSDRGERYVVGAHWSSGLTDLHASPLRAPL